MLHVTQIGLRASEGGEDHDEEGHEITDEEYYPEAGGDPEDPEEDAYEGAVPHNEVGGNFGAGGNFVEYSEDVAPGAHDALLDEL